MPRAPRADRVWLSSSPLGVGLSWAGWAGAGLGRGGLRLSEQGWAGGRRASWRAGPEGKVSERGRACFSEGEGE